MAAAKKKSTSKLRETLDRAARRKVMKTQKRRAAEHYKPHPAGDAEHKKAMRESAERMAKHEVAIWDIRSKGQLAQDKAKKKRGTYGNASRQRGKGPKP